jgi:DNA-binding MurR/RpiR family transcriptional regulator
MIADPESPHTGASIPARILARIEHLSPSETKVAKAILEDYPDLALRSAAAIGQASGTSPATVLRCVARLGFETLPAFHSALREEVRFRLSAARFYEAPGAGTTLPGPLVETERRNLDEAFSRLSADALRSIRQVLTLPLLWIYGGRFSYSLAYYLYAHLHLLRPRVSLLNTSSVPIAEEIVEVGRGHGLVIFDFREYELEALFAARYARSRRSQILLVTDPELSPAARYANHVLPIPVNKPLPSFTAVTAAVDALVLDLIQNRPDTVTQQSGRIAESRQLLRQLRADESHAERRRDPGALLPLTNHTPSATLGAAAPGLRPEARA